MELPEGACVYFYLDHIGMSVSVNGENVYDMSNEINSDMCGTGWQEWLLPAMAEGDFMEINLHNPHRYGSDGFLYRKPPFPIPRPSVPYTSEVISTSVVTSPVVRV